MGFSRNYHRMFVTLKQSDASYTLKSRTAMGRCIAEIKQSRGRFSTYMQDLFPEVIYYVFAFFIKSGAVKCVFVGNTGVSVNGRGEFKREFNPDNMFDSGFAIEDFKAAAVAVNGNNGVYSVLEGYIDESIEQAGGIRRFISEGIKSKINKNTDKNIAVASLGDDGEKFEIDKKDVEEHLENLTNETVNKGKISEDILNEKNLSAEIKEEELYKENLTEEMTEEKSIKDDTNKTEDIKIKDEHVEEELLKETADNKELEKSMAFEAEHKEDKEDITNVSPHIDFISCSMENKSFIDNVFEKNVKMNPFQFQNGVIDWVRISDNELALIPSNTWRIVNSPFINNAYRKYKHLILGNRNVPYSSYYLAVPGVYNHGKVTEAMIQGFKQFKCCEDKKPEEGDYGYWILEFY